MNDLPPIDYDYTTVVEDAVTMNDYSDVNGDTLLRLLAAARAILRVDNVTRIALENELTKRLS